MTHLRYRFLVSDHRIEALIWGHPRNFRESSSLPGFSSLDVRSNPQSWQLGKSAAMAKLFLHCFPFLSSIKNQSPENLSQRFNFFLLRSYFPDLIGLIIDIKDWFKCEIYSGNYERTPFLLLLKHYPVVPGKVEHREEREALCFNGHLPPDTISSLS